MRKFNPVIIFLMMTYSGVSLAQITTGNLEGRIVDQAGEPVSLVSVVVTGPDLQGDRLAMSFPDGFFHVPALPVGHYAVKFSHISCNELVIQDVTIQLGRTTGLGEVRLEPRIHQAEEVIVYGRKPQIDPRSTTIGANLSDHELASLPTERDYRLAIAYLPQSNTSFLGDATNIAGSTGSENTYIIDGVNVSDSYLATESTRLPMSFIREIEVKAGGYQAEFGRALGGVVNVITRSGSNDFRGQVFAFLTDNNFAADNRLGTIELAQDDFTRYDVGFSLGGPVVRDRLWYFVAYDPSIESEDLVLPGFDAYEDRLTRQQYAGKLTWRASPSTTFDLTVFGDPTSHDRVGANFIGAIPLGIENPDPMLGKWETGGTTVALSGQHLVGNSFLIDLDMSRQSSRRKADPLTEYGRNEQMIVDFETGIWSGGYQSIFDFRSTRSAARLTGTLHLENHQLKAGLEYEDNELDAYWMPTGAGQHPAGRTA